MEPTSKPQRPIGFKPGEISALINEEVVTQHAEEAAFLWLLRDGATSAPNYSLQDLADLDERVEAHIDGLRIAGSYGWKVAEEELGKEEAGEIFSAGVLAFESGDAERIRKVLEIGGSEAELQRGLVSALGWLKFDQVKNLLTDFLVSEQAESLRVGIAAFAVHRRDPGEALLAATSHPDARLRARALEAAGELGRSDLMSRILYLFSDEDEGCRFFAAWSAARLGNRTPPVFDALRKIVDEGNAFAESALGIALRCMRVQEARDWVGKLRDNPEKHRLAALGAGVIGDPALAGDLIAFMENDEMTRVAGEAFSMITGVDLAYDDLDGDEPEDFAGGPTENPEDEEVDLDPDEDLPWAVPDLVSKWWNEHRGNFRAGVRYLRGKEITTQSLRETLVKGNQRQRAAAALELAIQEPAQPLFEVRAPGKRQLERLQSWTS